MTFHRRRAHRLPAGFAPGLLLLGLLPIPVSGQAPPATDIWVLELDEAPEMVALGTPERLTDRAGYDNQPHFLPGGDALLYTAIDETGQADIRRIDLRSGRSRAVTRTAPESEYSPTLMPGGEAISVVRVEADSTQRLWRFDLDGTPVAPILDDVAPVGYHAWADPGTVVLYVLGEPSTLQVVRPGTGEIRIEAREIGRTILPVPGTERTVSFLQHRGENDAWITELDPATGAIRPLVRVFAENEFYAWTPNGTLLTARESQVHAWRPGWEGWRPVADLSPHGITGISRLAVSPEGHRLALVAERRAQRPPSPK